MCLCKYNKNVFNNKFIKWKLQYKFQPHNKVQNNRILNQVAFFECCKEDIFEIL